MIKCLVNGGVGRDHGVLADFISTHNATQGTHDTYPALNFSAIGNKWFRYTPPDVLSLSPQKFLPGPVNITVRGRNFGPGLGIGIAIMSSETDDQAACDAVNYVSSNELVCRLNSEPPFRAGQIRVNVSGQLSKTGETSVFSLLEGTALSSAKVSMRLGKVCEDIPEGSSARTEFSQQFLQDVSDAMQVESKRLTIDSIGCGSVVVNFEIHPDSDNLDAPSATSLVGTLHQMMSDPLSRLRQGVLTRSALSLSELSMPSSAGSVCSTSPAWKKLCTSGTNARERRRCLDCCTYDCEVQSPTPCVNNAPVPVGDVAGECKRVCMLHCGFA